MGKFFDVKYLLDMRDQNGDKPEIFIICSRGRGIGKTTSLCMHFIDYFFETGYKFVLVCRKSGHVGHFAEGVLKGAASMRGGWTVEEKVGIKGVYSNIYLTRINIVDDEEEKETVHVGYVVSIRNSYDVKSVSSMFIDSWCSFQDEFIAQEDDEYLPNEVNKLQNMHTSLARGDGKAVRYYPHFMSANCIDVLNPYFIALSMVGKIQSDTRKYRGNGVVYMRYESDVIADEHEASGFNRAFSGNGNENNFKDNSWLVGESSLVTKPDPRWGNPIYQYMLHDGDLWLKLSYYPCSGIFMLGYGKETGIRTFSIGKEPVPGEMMWDAPGVTVRKSLRDRFKNGMLMFRTEQAKRDYMAHF